MQEITKARAAPPAVPWLELAMAQNFLEPHKADLKIMSVLPPYEAFCLLLFVSFLII